MARSLLILLTGLASGFILGSLFRRYGESLSEASVEEMAEDVAKRLDYLEDQFRAV